MMVVVLFFYYEMGPSSFQTAEGGINASTFQVVFRPSLTILSYYATMYYLTTKGVISRRTMGYFFAFVLVGSILTYFKSIATMSFIKGVDLEMGGFTNNTGYLFISLLPFLFLLNKRIVQLVLYLIILFFVIYSSKRGAMVILFVFSFYFISVNYLKGRKFSNYLLVAALLVIGYYILMQIIGESEFIENKIIATIEDNSVNERDKIAETLWTYFWGENSKLYNYLFGHGVASTVKVAGNWAHNDWLEFLLTSGFFGLFLYATFFKQLFSVLKRNKCREFYYYILFSCSMIWFIKSLFSMAFLISGSDFYPLVIIMGYASGCLYNRKTNRIVL